MCIGAGVCVDVGVGVGVVVSERVYVCALHGGIGRRSRAGRARGVSCVAFVCACACKTRTVFARACVTRCVCLCVFLARCPRALP